MEVMRSLIGPYDFIFMDAAKGQYIHYMPEAIRLLVPDGVLMSDNVLQDGDIIESRFAVERRNRTIHSRMREYLYELKHDERLQTSILPLGDGVALVSENRRERIQESKEGEKEMEQKRPELLDPGKQPGSIKDGSCFRCRCRILEANHLDCARRQRIFRWKI